MSVKINKNAWSEKSKESLNYVFAKKFYENIIYTCRKCKKESIFSAEEQKISYEIQNNYIDQKKIFCEKCYINYKELKKQIHGYETKWQTESEKTKNTATYISEWLSAMNEMQSYGKPINEAMAKNLHKLISANA